MARIEECNQCESFKSGLCTRLWKEPSFNDTPCEMQATPSITQDNQENTVEGTDEEQPVRRIHKRGSSAAGHTTKRIVAKRENHPSPSEEDEETEHAIYVGEKSFRLLTYVKDVLVVCVILALVLGIWYGGHYYFKQKEIAFKEDLAVEAKNKLRPMLDENIFQYLKLVQLTYEDNSLCFKYADRKNAIASALEQINKQYHGEELNRVSHDIKLQFFLSALAMKPHEWDAACQLLDSAGVDVKVRFIGVDEPCELRHEQLSQYNSQSDIFQKSKNIFIINKKIEVLEYAITHFLRDRVFGIDSVSISPNYVTLHLNYDDTYNLGESYLDTAYINSHFTDPVGEMGSIVDNMLSICSLTNCGIAFEYVGRKKHQVTRWEWDSSRTQAFLAKYSGIIPYRKRKTNQVHTTIVTRKQE